MSEEFKMHPWLRIYPRAQDTGGVEGEWELTIRGSEEDFRRAHNALSNEGFYVDERGDYEVYVPKFIPTDEYVLLKEAE